MGTNKGEVERKEAIDGLEYLKEIRTYFLLDELLPYVAGALFGQIWKISFGKGRVLHKRPSGINQFIFFLQIQGCRLRHPLLDEYER